MKLTPFFPVLLLAATAGGCAASANRPDTAAAVNELAPTGRIRFGLAFAPEQSTFFVIRNADGSPRGVTVELATDLAKKLGRPIEFVLAPNTGELTDKLTAGTIDAAFMPVDAERQGRVDFGPAYAMGENTYLVRAGSDIKAIADVDRPGVRVIGIANTTTIRSAAGLLKRTDITPVDSVDNAMAMIRAGQVDAFALTRDTLLTLAAGAPGSRILDGSFRQLFIAIAVPKGRHAAHAFVTAWLDDAKTSGTVRQAFDRAGFTTSAVAP